MTKDKKHNVVSRSDGYGNRSCSCGGTWNDADDVCSTLMTMTKDKERESSGEMLQRLGMDGKLWAEELHKHFPQVAEDDLLGWCCSMIMAGYDEAMRRCAALDTSDELVEALEYCRNMALNGMASHRDCIVGACEQALAKHKQRKMR